MKLGTGRHRDHFAKGLAGASFLAMLTILVLTTPALLLALAYASPPDPSWIPGIYDDADYDDVVTLVTSATADVAPALPVDSRPIVSSVESVLPFIEHTSLAPSRLASHPRAPPVP
jgi:hypothetical protein